MSVAEEITLFVLAYLLTGIALTGYDFSAPAAERKMYVLRRNYAVATITWFVWPITVVHEALTERKMNGRYWRFLIGVFVLSVAMYLWTTMAYLLCLWLIGSAWVALIVTTVAMLLFSPIITAIAMPPYPGRN